MSLTERERTSTLGINAYHCVGDFGGQPMHLHEEVEFVAVYRGRGKFRRGRSVHETGPGVLSVVPPQEPHAGTPAHAEFAVKVLNVSARWFGEAALDPRTLWHQAGVCDTPAAIPAFFVAYETVVQQQPRLLQEEALLALCQALTSASLPSKTISETNRIHQAAAFLQERFTEELPLADLASEAGLTPAYLCRAFTQTLGLPPHAYQIGLRVAKAKTLLERGVSPGEAAAEVGFYDQSHLTRHFKRLLGHTPAQISRRSKSS